MSGLALGFLDLVLLFPGTSFFVVCDILPGLFSVALLSGATLQNQVFINAPQVDNSRLGIYGKLIF